VGALGKACVGGFWHWDLEQEKASEAGGVQAANFKVLRVLWVLGNTGDLWAWLGEGGLLGYLYFVMPP